MSNVFLSCPRHLGRPTSTTPGVLALLAGCCPGLKKSKGKIFATWKKTFICWKSSRRLDLRSWASATGRASTGKSRLTGWPKRVSWRSFERPTGFVRKHGSADRRPPTGTVRPAQVRATGKSRLRIAERGTAACSQRVARPHPTRLGHMEVPGSDVCSPGGSASSVYVPRRLAAHAKSTSRRRCGYNRRIRRTGRSRRGCCDALNRLSATGVGALAKRFSHASLQVSVE
jgi:hypothetical protein